MGRSLPRLGVGRDGLTADHRELQVCRGGESVLMRVAMILTIDQEKKREKSGEGCGYNQVERTSQLGPGGDSPSGKKKDQTNEPIENESTDHDRPPCGVIAVSRRLGISSVRTCQ